MPSNPPPSAITAIPPSRLLLPRVRSIECPRRAGPRNSLPDVSGHDTALEWLGLPLAFDVVQDQVEIDGYQMYAVEKWIVERTRPITVLTVYTGDPSHKITVTALAPSSSLSEKDAAVHWEQALLHLRRDASARPKQTPVGVLMATSLAYFRSDYTIVHIPHGNFLQAQDQLYVNINLLRMGCGGRSALTLEEPSDSTKDRFISTYHIPEITQPCNLPLPLHDPTSSDHLPLPPSQPISPSSSLVSKDPHLTSPSPRPLHHRNYSQTSPKGSISRIGANRPSIHIVGPSPTPQSITRSSLGPTTLALLSGHAKGKVKDLPFFNATVLELVKLVQVGLSLFGMYDVKEGLSYAGGLLLVDGLLCDVTVRGIERWIAEIGEPRAGLEPAERIADPMFVSALLSLVLSIRNKLSSLCPSHVVPKDPFLHPHAFSVALSSYISSTLSSQTSSPSSPPMIPAYVGNGSHYLSLPPIYASITTAPFSATAFLNPNPSFAVAHSHISNASQHHITGVLAALTRELVEVIEIYYAKRVASINEGESTSAPAGGLGSGIVGVGNGGTGVRTSSPGIRDSPNTISGGTSGSSGMPRSQARGRVKRTLKGKLEDLTSAVSSTVTDNYDGGEGGGDRGRDDSRIGGGGGGGGGGGRTLSGTEADENLSVGNSGGQIFRGMGNLLLSGASGITGTGSGSNGTAGIWDTNVDLERFVISIVNEQPSRKRGRRKKGSGKGNESVDFGRGGITGPSSGTGGRSSAQFPGTPTIPQSIVNGEHGTLVTMLWSGRVADILALREWEKERERIENTEVSGLPNLAPISSVTRVVSDGEEARSEGLGGRSTEGEDSDLQMEDRLGSGGGFGSVWGERMQRKLGSWTGFSKRRGQSTGNEFESIGSIGRSGKGGTNRLSLGSRSPSSKAVSSDIVAKADPNLALSRAQSPTLHPGPLSGDLEQDDMLYDSGPYSPSSEYKHNPFILDDQNLPKGTRLYDISRGVSAAELGRSGSSNVDTGPPPSKAQSPLYSTDALTNTGILPLQPAFELDPGKESKSYAGLGAAGKRWERNIRQQRVSSWSDARSAWNEEGFWMSGNTKSAKGRPRLGRVNTTLDGMREEANVDDDVIDDIDVGKGKEEREELRERDDESDQDRWKTVRMLAVRRRSYHDLDSLRSIKVLSPDRMKIDVELCAQVLIMVRREEHLRNVVACLETLTSSLQMTNSVLQNDFELHKDAILEIERRAQVISEIEGQVRQTDSITQAKNTLQYESAQFLISELWHTASLSRKKVFELREKVFGAGGRRRLPAGKHGAHGKYDRVQWTLEGERRLVDFLGRTEQEAEGENRMNVAGLTATRPPPLPEDEEEDVIEHSGIKPMWLLRFFTSWGTRWSALRVGGGQQTAVTTTNTSDGTRSESSSGTTAEKGVE